MKKVFILSTLFIALFAVQEASAVVIAPTVRGQVFGSSMSTSTNVISLVHTATADNRGIFEYDVSGITDPVTSAILELELYNSGRGPYPFDIDFYSYPGNGALDATDWSEGGMKFTTVSYNGELLLNIDVTSQVQFLTGGGGDYLGINLRLPDEYTGPDPGTQFNTARFYHITLGPDTTHNLNVTTQSGSGGPSGSTAVPEPSTMILTGLGLGFATLRKKFKHS